MGYVGFHGGLSSELVKLTAVVAGFFLSFRYYQTLGDFLAEQTFLRVEWAAALALVAGMVVTYLLLTRVLRLMEKLVQVSFETRLNQMGGLVVGLVRAGLVTSVLLVTLRQLPSESLAASIEQHSLTGPVISRLAPAIYDTCSPLLSRFWMSLRNQPA